MSHRVHPKAYRLREIKDWYSRWYTQKNLSTYLEEDFKIRNFLEKRLKDCGVQNIEIEKFPDKINIIINSSRPGLIIGKGGKGIEEIKQRLDNKILKNNFLKKKKQIKIDIKEVRDPWYQANLVSQWIAFRIEKRFPYRKVLKQAIEKVTTSKAVKGIRVQVAGRLNGAEIARREWLKVGLLPRQNLRAEIDYGTANAYCSYGVVGVKVWIYKGERFW